jgi:methylenetetrahydrofolate dehydrogenase (NADP+)/methenyltetrahydrofolate cyclohydrolase
MSDPAKLIDGKAIALKIRAELKKEVEALKKNRGITPGLAVILVGENPASKVYVRNKAKACAEVGIMSFEHTLPEDAPEAGLLRLISGLNSAKEVHGILVQLPLPHHIDAEKVLEAVDPKKDVDGFHPYNMGRLMMGRPNLEPCTPLGIMRLIDSTGIDIGGKEAVVVGRSNIVGKPMAMMLLKRHSTVTICHSRTQGLPMCVGRADVLIAAVGKERFIKGDWIRPGSIVIDVGINRTAEGGLAGDVDFEGAFKRAGFITPVPGGVGPMTIAMLLKNTVDAAKAGIGHVAQGA